MKNARYDIPRLRRDMKTLADQLRALKKKIRTPHFLPCSHDYKDLRLMKKAYTYLCCLRAHHRGRLHLQNAELSLSTAASIEEKYLLQEAAA